MDPSFNPKNTFLPFLFKQVNLSFFSSSSFHPLTLSITVITAGNKERVCVCVCVRARARALTHALSHVPNLYDPMDCSQPGSSVHGISQARILEWVAMSFSRESSWSQDWTCVSCVSCIAGRFFITGTSWEAPVSEYSHLIIKLQWNSREPPPKKRNMSTCATVGPPSHPQPEPSSSWPFFSFPYRVQWDLLKDKQSVSIKVMSN